MENTIDLGQKKDGEGNKHVLTGEIAVKAWKQSAKEKIDRRKKVRVPKITVVGGVANRDGFQGR